MDGDPYASICMWLKVTQKARTRVSAAGKLSLAGTLARCLCHEGNLTLLAARPNQSVHTQLNKWPPLAH